MLYIDDKARGVHEGYLVTPITTLEMVLGLNLAGAIKAILAGVHADHSGLADRRAGLVVSAVAHRCSGFC